MRKNQIHEFDDTFEFPFTIEYPRSGLCPITGQTIHRLVELTEGPGPAVKKVVLRQTPGKRGVELILFDSLMSVLMREMEKEGGDQP